jgi:hypothetical protein
MSGEGEFAMWIAIGMGQVAFWIAITPIIKAFANRIGGKGGADQLLALEERLGALEQRGFTSGEVEAQFHRLAEVEERLDFTERMLATRVDQHLNEEPS